MGEFDIIARYFAPLSVSCAGALGLKDDAAILVPSPGCDLVVTCDTLIENVHFLPASDPHNLALKLLGVNLSDLAAMGARPVGYVLALTLPLIPSPACGGGLGRGLPDRTECVASAPSPTLPREEREREFTGTEAWIKAFTDGLREGLARYGGALIGGDTTSHNGPLILTLTAFGEVPHGQALKRSGAKVGDAVFVSGTIGDGYLGLQQCRAGAGGYLAERYLIPTPRVALGMALCGIASACADISDGLVADLGHICAASGVGAEVALATVPLSKEARASGAALMELVTGGDDYELVFTVPEHRLAALPALDIPLTRIGTVTAGEGVTVRDAAGQVVVMPKAGWQYF